MRTIKIDDLMKQSRVSFGTSGARGLVTDMTDSVCYNYVMAFLQYVNERNEASSDSNVFLADRKVAISGDFRPSTSRIIRAVFRAAQDQGFLPIDCGRFPTPTLGLYTLEQQIPGIMVTGSHVSEDRNGLKFFLPTGEILKSDEAHIRNQVVEQIPEMFDEEGNLLRILYLKWVATDRGDAAQTYYMRYAHGFPEDCLHGFRIGFYEHSSVARDLLGDLYESLGAEVVRLGRTEKFVAVDTEAVSEDLLVHVQALTVTGEFDAILSTDGDGDRPLIFDEHGEMIPGDIAGIITAMFLGADTVVTPITSNTALEKSAIFPKIVRTKVGSPYVIEGMERAKRESAKSIVGYEANGGFMTGTTLFLHERFQNMGFSRSPKSPTLAPLPTRDPAIVHLALLLTAKLLQKPFSHFHRMLPLRTTKSDRLAGFPTKLAGEKLQQLREHHHGKFTFIESTFPDFGKLTGIDLTDGVRMTFNNSNIVHLRASGNAPELRCYVETEKPEDASKILRESLEIIEKWR